MLDLKTVFHNGHEKELCERGLLTMQELVCLDLPCSVISSMTLVQLRQSYALQWF